ncbi:YpfJ protein, zinc metalloprotease superfamily protein [Minicystis rosea]|nr:YpfJ protein, zinc metalloprotease superfamily protein [Minicystis rosea]
MADGSEVEDRRGFPGGGLGLAGSGLGLLGLIVVGVVRLLGGEVTTSDGHRPPRHDNDKSARAPSHAPVGGSCQGVSSSTDQGKFVTCVQTHVQRFWAAKLGPSYEPAKMVLFTDATSSGCGQASAATGPFYCPADQKVYLDTGFFQALHTRFHAQGGDFAEAYIVAHEYGHHVQKLRGIETRVRREQERDRRRANEWSVALELQADCFAGVWAHAAYAQGKVATEEIAQALDAAAAVGDDRIQQQATGHVRPERFTHGSARERMTWLQRGMETGDPARCDTFASR